MAKSIGIANLKTNAKSSAGVNSKIIPFYMERINFHLKTTIVKVPFS